MEIRKKTKKASDESLNFWICSTLTWSINKFIIIKGGDSNDLYLEIDWKSFYYMKYQNLLITGKYNNIQIWIMYNKH